MDFLNQLVSDVNGVLWGVFFLIPLLCGTGIFYTIKLRFVQVRKFGLAARFLLGGASLFGKRADKSGMSSFQALATAVAAQVGTGNVAGTATALVAGGPGSLFWLWVAAFFGMATIFAEAVLAQTYRTKDEQGRVLGGPAYYIGTVIGSSFFASVFAVLLAVTYGLIFNSVQANTISLSMQTSFGFDTQMTGLAIAGFTALVIFGGLTRIAKVVGVMVPVMAGAYILVALAVTALNITMVPEVLVTIVRCAFDFDAVLGAGFGMALMTGIKRGLFSNEAGMGAVPNAAATADATHPAKQGLVQALGVYFDTLVVCTASAMLVLLTPGWADSGKTGIELIQQTLTGQLGTWTNAFMSVTVLFFAFSSIIGNYFYGEINMDFISRHPAALWIYRAFVVMMVYLGSVASLGLVWNLADLFMALMAIVNLVAIAILGKYAFIALDDYVSQKKRGILNPEFDPSVMPNHRGILCWPRHKEEEIEQC